MNTSIGRNHYFNKIYQCNQRYSAQMGHAEIVILTNSLDDVGAKNYPIRIRMTPGIIEISEISDIVPKWDTQKLLF
jgi:hypothetical protein